MAQGQVPLRHFKVAGCQGDKMRLKISFRMGFTQHVSLLPQNANDFCTISGSRQTCRVLFFLLSFWNTKQFSKHS